MAEWQNGSTAEWKYRSMAEYGKIGQRMDGSTFRMFMNPVNAAKLLLSY